MLTVILASWMVRYPLGGNLSWTLQQVLSYKELGHDIYLVEKYGYVNSCYDPVKKISSNDCSHGISVVGELMARFGLAKKWCYVQTNGVYHGLSKQDIDRVFERADLFVDATSDYSWTEEAYRVPIRVLIDGEPGFSQMHNANKIREGNSFAPEIFNFWYTNGRNIGRPGNPVPTLGLQWEHIYSPVCTAVLNGKTQTHTKGYTTVMNWQSHKTLLYNGKVFGQKDIEFAKFLTLPKLVKAELEVAVSGKVPTSDLLANGWKISDAQAETITFDSFCNYVAASRGEFSVVKNVFVANNTAWFSDKSAVYLALKKPVILQDTGFSAHLPVGEGLFAVNNVEEAAAAIDDIERNYHRHANAAYQIAQEYFEGRKVLEKFLSQLSM